MLDSITRLNHLTRCYKQLRKSEDELARNAAVGIADHLVYELALMCTCHDLGEYDYSINTLREMVKPDAKLDWQDFIGDITIAPESLEYADDDMDKYDEIISYLWQCVFKQMDGKTRCEFLNFIQVQLMCSDSDDNIMELLQGNGVFDLLG